MEKIKTELRVNILKEDRGQALIFAYIFMITIIGAAILIFNRSISELALNKRIELNIRAKQLAYAGINNALTMLGKHLREYPIATGYSNPDDPTDYSYEMYEDNDIDCSLCKSIRQLFNKDYATVKYTNEATSIPNDDCVNSWCNINDNEKFIIKVIRNENNPDFDAEDPTDYTKGAVLDNTELSDMKWGQFKYLIESTGIIQESPTNPTVLAKNTVQAVATFIYYTKKLGCSRPEGSSTWGSNCGHKLGDIYINQGEEPFWFGGQRDADGNLLGHPLIPYGYYNLNLRLEYSGQGNENNENARIIIGGTDFILWDDNISAELQTNQPEWYMAVTDTGPHYSQDNYNPPLGLDCFGDDAGDPLCIEYVRIPSAFPGLEDCTDYPNCKKVIDDPEDGHGKHAVNHYGFIEVRPNARLQNGPILAGYWGSLTDSECKTENIDWMDADPSYEEQSDYWPNTRRAQLPDRCSNVPGPNGEDVLDFYEKDPEGVPCISTERDFTGDFIYAPVYQCETISGLDDGDDMYSCHEDHEEGGIYRQCGDYRSDPSEGEPLRVQDSIDLIAWELDRVYGPGKPKVGSAPGATGGGFDPDYNVGRVELVDVKYLEL